MISSFIQQKPSMRSR